MAQMVPIYDFILEDGTVTGCGTKLELDYWTNEGVFDHIYLGGKIGEEPASEDDRRLKAWGCFA